MNFSKASKIVLGTAALLFLGVFVVVFLQLQTDSEKENILFEVGGEPLHDQELSFEDDVEE